MSAQIEFNFKCPPVIDPQGVANFDFPEKECLEILLESDGQTGETSTVSFATLLAVVVIPTGEQGEVSLSHSAQLVATPATGEDSNSSLSISVHPTLKNLYVGENLSLFTILIAPHAEITSTHITGQSLQKPNLETTIFTTSRNGQAVTTDLTTFESSPLVQCYSDGHTLALYTDEVILSPDNPTIQRIPYAPALRLDKSDYSISFQVYLDPTPFSETEIILDRAGIYYQRWSSYGVLYRNSNFGIEIGAGTNPYQGTTGFSLKPHPRGYWYFIEVIKSNNNVALYVDGQFEYQLTNVYTDNNTSADLILGRLESGLFPFRGKIKNLAFRDTSTHFNCGIAAYENLTVQSSLVLPVFLDPHPTFTGEDTSASAQISTLFDSSNSVGESTPYVELITAIGRTIIVDYLTGESASTDLLCDIRVYAHGQTGENSTATLQSASIFSGLSRIGESSTATLHVTPPIRLSCDVYSSELLSPVALQTSSILDFGAVTGELLAPVFDTHPSFGLDLNAINVGVSVTSKMTNVSLIRATIQVKGVAISVDLVYPKAQGLSLARAYTGQQASGSLKLGYYNLQQIQVYDGASGVLEILSEEPNIFVGHGETVVATLSTTVVMPLRPATISGSLEHTDLETFRYVIFPVIEYAEVTTYEWYIEVIEVTLNPRARTGENHNNSFNSTLDFSLQSLLCCPKPTLNPLHTDIDFYPLPYDLRFDNRTITSLDLSLCCRFFLKGINFAGETAVATISPNGAILTPLSCNADVRYTSYDNTMQMANGLCRGQFNTIGYNLVVELDLSGEGDCSPAYQYFTGDTLECELFVFSTIESDYFMDSRLQSVMLEVDYPMKARGYAGDRYRAAFEVTFEPHIYIGVSYSAKFYVPPYKAYTGELLQVEIISALAVRFLEDGCLTNDFTSSAADGQAVEGRFNPVPVEGEPYYHWIKTECYSPSTEEISKLESA